MGIWIITELTKMVVFIKQFCCFLVKISLINIFLMILKGFTTNILQLNISYLKKLVFKILVYSFLNKTYLTYLNYRRIVETKQLKNWN